MEGLVLGPLVPSEVSEAVSVALPAVLNVTAKLFVPATRAALTGKPALESEDVIPTMSVTLVRTFQKGSTALTVMLNAAPAVCGRGVPVLPLVVAGAAVSPGTRSCSLAKAAGLTTIGSDSALVRPVAVKLMVMFVATLCERLLKVTRPPAAVMFVVPCKVPLPALRVAVTIVLLSLVRKLPNWSSIRITGCGAKGAPAIAAGDGCV